MFNKIFIKAVMIIIFLLIFNSPISCYAMNTEGKSDNGLCYEITNYGTVTITGYTGVESEIVIPETIEGYNVTSIGASAFSGNKLLTKITMPYVKVIGESAFSNTGLESVNLTGITSMGNYAFSGCDNLSAVELIDVSSMGYRTFYYCRNLKTIVAKGNTKLSSLSVFEYDDNIEYVELDGLPEINRISFSAKTVKFRMFNW